MYTRDQLAELFEKHSDDNHCQFDLIPVAERRHERPDLCGILLLAERFPVKNDRDMICSAEHDQIWFDTELDDYEAPWPLTEDDVVYLLRCGLWWDSDVDNISAFV
jgi:hypothetical protein